MRLTSIQRIDTLGSGIGGGKAQGLKTLLDLGATIPETYVVTKWNQEEIEHFVDQLPAKSYAVRSSADAEDGIEYSYAGQFESYLDITGKEELVKAIKACFASASSDTVKSYKKGIHASNGSSMNVLIQEMISAAYSGVLFTADPVLQRHDLFSLSIAKGVGEELMAGHEAGENHSFFKHSTKLPKSDLLDDKLLEELLASAKRIEKGYGKPADLEWAIDKSGTIWWLQLRPITSLSEVHFNELDNQPSGGELLYTRGNIGEMMPGPVTPLTLSTFARAIEVGLQRFYKKMGAISELSDDNIFVHSYYNHLFFDMERLYDSTRNVMMSKKENIDFAIVGQIIPNKEVKVEVRKITALQNFIAMTRYINSAPKAWTKLKNLHDTFFLAHPDNSKEAYKIIDKNQHVLLDAYSLHYVTSSQSGALYTAILNIHSKNKVPQMQHQEMVAKLFSNIPDVESANVLKTIDEMAKILADVPDVSKDFVSASDKDSLTYLSKSGPDAIRKSWDVFIKRHGHRCVREAELHEKEWAVDPMPVIEGLKTKTALLVNGQKGKINGFAHKNISLRGNGLNWFGRQITSYLLPKARKAVSRREQTKAWSIGIQYQFKKAYQHLSGLLVKEGQLDDADQIFFLQHDEIGKLVSGDNPISWKEKANKRREIYPKLSELSFPDLSFGIPVPEVEEGIAVEGGLSGIPVSQGLVKGKVRLVKSMKEARLLKENEIMVAKFTDIGWTPFYSVVAGLITEIGSPLSHGAVVAREYGLPAVVSMKGAMSTLIDGQHIELDAVKGTVTVLD